MLRFRKRTALTLSLALLVSQITAPLSAFAAPVVTVSTFLGGSGIDSSPSIARDDAGNLYVSGHTSSPNFPQATGFSGVKDHFVTKFDPTGTTILYSTYIGGSGDEDTIKLTVDAAGNVYVSGGTASTDFPVTAGAFQTTYGGGAFDGYVAKLDSTGAIVYATYIGGTGRDEGFGIAVDASGNAYVTGRTTSANFPTVNAFQPTYGGGGSAVGDVYVAKLNPSGSALLYSTYLGGSAEDQGFDIAIDETGNAYVTGDTKSGNFPTTLGAFQTAFAGGNDGFVTKVSPSGSTLAYSTYLGGNLFDRAESIALDAAGSAYIAGSADSSNFPTTPGTFQPAPSGASGDAFLTKLNLAGSGLDFSTYIGDGSSVSANGVAVDSAGIVYVTGDVINTPPRPDLYFATFSADGSDRTSFLSHGGSDDEFGGDLAIDANGTMYSAAITSSADFPVVSAVQSTYGGGAADAVLVIIEGAVETRVISTSPANATHSASASTDVSATFNQSIDAGSIDDQTFVVHAMQSRRLLSANGDITSVQGSGPTVTLNPANDFHPGELVQVIATAGIENTAQAAATPHVWQFRTKVSGGNGLFLDSGQALGSANSRDVALGDLDGDGDLDAFVANFNGQENQVWLNTGNGTFNGGQLLGNSSSAAVSLGDVDGDGDLDAFVANASNQANRVWRNNGNGTFISSQLLGSSDSREVGLSDLDGDGDLDAFVTNNSFQGNRVWLNDGTGMFVDSGQSLGDSLSDELSMGDVDGDGDIDAYVANDAQANRVWLNNGTGTFIDSGQILGIFDRRSLSLGDVDGDGDLDAFVVNVNHNRVWLNNGGMFTDTEQFLAGGNGQDVSLGDVDADGDLDAFVVNVNNQVNRVWLNNGNGVFVDSGQMLGSSTSEGVELGDLDGDGDLDAFVVNDRFAPTANKVWLNNVAPMADAGVNQTINEGDPLSLDASASFDPDGGILTFSWDVNGNSTFGDAVGETPTLSATQLALLGIADGPDNFTVTVRVTDDNGSIDEDSMTLTVNNINPVLSNLLATTIDENGTTTVTGTITDPGILDTLTLDIDWGDPLSPGNTEQVLFPASPTGTQNFVLMHQYLDDNPSGTASDDYTIDLIMTDNDTGTTNASTPVTVDNVAPDNVIIAPIIDTLILAAGEVAAFTGSFTDVGTLDTHTAQWTFKHTDGSGNTIIDVQPGTVTQGSGNGTVSDTFSFSEAGVYFVTLTITDDDTGTTTSLESMFVVFDSTEGFVTGNGRVDSPPGAYIPNPSITGTARFAFQSQFIPGTSSPTGDTQFNLRVASQGFNFFFESISYDWLVVAGSRAKFKGVGTIDDAGNFGFLVTVIDGEIAGGGGVDKFRIKIWDKDDNDTVVYDNQFGDDETADPTAEILTGQIIIHKTGQP